MADTHHQQNRQQGRKRNAGEQAAQATPEPTPGLDAVKAITVKGEAAATSTVAILRAHPMERDEILAWLHQHRGNAFVQQVTGKLGPAETALPEGVDLQTVRASVTIPRGRTLTGDWKSKVATRDATQLSIEISPTGVRAYLSPSLHVDATWPLQNAEIRGAGVKFADGKAYADVVDGHGIGSGMISISDKVEDKLINAITTGIAGSPLAQPGYVPTHDAQLGGTLDKLMRGFSQLFDDDKDKDGKPDHGDKKKATLSASDLGHVSAGATVSLKAGGHFMKDGTGLQIDPGSELTLSLEGAGNLDEILRSGTPADAAKAAAIQTVRVNASGLRVVSKGKPVAQLSSLSIRPGGGVTVDSMSLLGKARDAQVMESGISLLFGLMALAGKDSNAAGGALRNAQNPEVVDGVAKAMIEKQFTESVQKLILQYRGAVPGLDLATILGFG